MNIKTPSFWYRQKTTPAPALEYILSPLSSLYGLGHKINQARRSPQSVDVPVICVGNLIAGGAGKTVAAQSLMNLISNNDITKAPYFLTRGYGGTQRSPSLIEPSGADYKTFGDEALLLAKQAPTIVAKDRYAGAQLAQALEASAIILDDGLQNRTLHKDVNIVVINGDMGFGNLRLLPAGPMREPLQDGLDKADAFILIGEDKRNVVSLLNDAPVFRATFETKDSELPSKDKRYIAFAGMGYPEKFFSYLQQLGYDVIEMVRFPDHAPYKDSEIKDLHKKAQKHKAALITTEKDAVRLPLIAEDFTIHTLPVTLKWANEPSVVAFLNFHLKP